MIRDRYIDFFRGVGLLLIIFVHINGPVWFSQFRCFDVPLMVFVSGLVYSGRKITDTYTFYLRRALRLILPVWIFFAIIYIPAFYLGESLGYIPTGYINFQKVISVFLLLDGYGYVWIIRVFLIIMLATPLLLKINDKLTPFSNLLFTLIAIITVETLIVKMLSQSNPRDILFFITNNYVVYLLAYSIFFILGLRIRQFKPLNLKEGKVYLVVCILIIAGIGVVMYVKDGELVMSPRYKYPPQLFYIVYGSAMCFLLWCFRNVFSAIASWKIFQYVGKNTIWIYLWHIPFVYFCNREIGNWGIRYLIVLIASLGVYYIQYKSVMSFGNDWAKRYLVG